MTRTMIYNNLYIAWWRLSGFNEIVSSQAAPRKCAQAR